MNNNKESKKLFRKKIISLIIYRCYLYIIFQIERTDYDKGDENVILGYFKFLDKCIIIKLA